MNSKYKLFKNREKEQLLKEIDSTVVALESVYSKFENVTEPDLIDCAIFELNAIQKRYHYLLKQIKELEKDIDSTGFYKNKAKNIIECMKKIHNQYNDEVPKTVEELTDLAGVGRKTANVIRGNIYNDPSIVVDTHVKRISRKLGLTKEEDPVKIEYDLMTKLPKDHWILYNIHLITLGRTICTARSPKCTECFLKEYCKEGHKI